MAGCPIFYKPAGSVWHTMRSHTCPEQTVPKHSLSSEYLRDEVDLVSFKDKLPPRLLENIINKWIVGKAKGIVDMFRVTRVLTYAGPFDEAARSFLSQHPDVERIDRNGIVTTAAQSQQSVTLFL